MKRRILTRGSARMRERGQKKVEVWLSEAQIAALESTVKTQRCSRTNFIRGAIAFAIARIEAGQAVCSYWGRIE